MSRPPSNFHGFFGQNKAIARICQQLRGARARGEPCPQILLIGQSGIGKTQLAGAIAEELKTNLLLGHGQDAMSDLVTKLLGATAGDIMFVDEIHNAKPKIQEMFFPVIDQSRLPGWAASASCGGAHNDFVEIQRVTLILATDQPGRLLTALLKRMDLVERLEPYPVREMEAIVDRVATDLDMLLSGQSRNHLARISLGLPRQAKHYLKALRRRYPDIGPGAISLPDVRRFLKEFGVDNRGLKREHRKILRFLAEIGGASIQSLAGQLGTDADYIARQIEPQLLHLRLIHISSGGRSLTDLGKRWIIDHPRTKSTRTRERND